MQAPGDLQDNHAITKKLLVCYWALKRNCLTVGHSMSTTAHNELGSTGISKLQSQVSSETIHYEMEMVH